MKFLHLIAAIVYIGAVVSTIHAEARYRFRGVEQPIRDISEGDLTYLSILDIAHATGCEIRWKPLSFRAQMILGRSDLVITLLSSYVTFDDQLLNITYPAIYRKGDLYVPAVTFIRALDYLVPASLSWNEDSMLVRAEETQYNVVGLRFEPRMNGYLIEILVREKLPYEVYVTEQNWINVNMFGGYLDQRHIRTTPRPKAIKKVRAFQFSESSQIAIRFFRPVTRFRHDFAADPPRIQISIIDTMFDASLLDSLEGTSRDRPDPIDIVIVDAGHGGEENGAVGAMGTKEKDIVLAVANELATLLSADSNLTVLMTRRSDTTMTLQERADFANGNSGDLFISIHANASADNPAAHGSQTFFLASALNDEARATAMLENSSLVLDRDYADERPSDDLEFILFDLLQTEFLSESQELAAYIQREIEGRLMIQSRGVDQAGFFVLNNVFMPSVLVELAFMSNSREEALLKKETFQRKAAEAICSGVKKFIDKYSVVD